jgi:PBP1b-binding outer membrane lipoprotein LpoB
MKSLIRLPFALAFALFFLSCAQHTVTRVNPDQQIDLSGRWNDTDSRLVAEEMVKDAINRDWRMRFVNSNSKKPTMIVGTISNKSHEFIEAETFLKNMEREFINTSTIRVVQNSELREKMRQERADQEKFSSPDTQKKWGREHALWQHQLHRGLGKQKESGLLPGEPRIGRPGNQRTCLDWREKD